jgi:hypothetical protein
VQVEQQVKLELLERQETQGLQVQVEQLEKQVQVEQQVKLELLERLV